MDSVFLGTGAAEMYPNPFCACQICQRARENRETRLRAAFLLDEKTMIDFGPDVPAASQHYGANLAEVENVLITHTHADHFNASTLDILTMTNMNHTMHFYFSPEGLEWVNTVTELSKHLGGTLGVIIDELLKRNKIALHALPLFETAQVGDKLVTPIRTNHHGNTGAEFAQNYLIDWAKGRWLYACDTGIYGEENLSFLKDFCKNGRALDVLITEGTNGSLHHPQSAGHMTAENLCIQMAKLRAVGALDDHTRVYITHINQVQHFSHAEYQAYLDLHAPAHVTVAHDGMRIY